MEEVQVPKRSPENMMNLRLPYISHTLTPWGMRELAREVLRIKERDGPRIANQLLINRIGWQPREQLNDQYYEEALNYHLGLLYGFFGQGEKMSECINRSNTMPCDDELLLFSDHVNTSFVLRARQLDAIRRGIPAVLMALMPRSASASLTRTLAEFLDAPVMHLSIGNFGSQLLPSMWVDAFLQGGAVTHDHFDASDFNIGMLKYRGVEEIFVLARDPRAAARSVVRMEERWTDAAILPPFEERFLDELERYFVPWLDGWLRCAARGDLKVHWLFYEDCKRDMAGVARHVCRILAEKHPAMAAYADAAEVPVVTSHLVTGDDDAWRNEVSAAMRERIWQCCTPTVRDHLGLKP